MSANLRRVVAVARHKLSGDKNRATLIDRLQRRRHTSEGEPPMLPSTSNSRLGLYAAARAERSRGCGSTMAGGCSRAHILECSKKRLARFEQETARQALIFRPRACSRRLSRRLTHVQKPKSSAGGGDLACRLCKRDRQSGARGNEGGGASSREPRDTSCSRHRRRRHRRRRRRRRRCCRRRIARSRTSADQRRPLKSVCARARRSSCYRKRRRRSSVAGFEAPRRARVAPCASSSSLIITSVHDERRTKVAAACGGDERLARQNGAADDRRRSSPLVAAAATRHFPALVLARASAFVVFVVTIFSDLRKRARVQFGATAFGDCAAADLRRK